jgi:hypothetical protein
MLFKQPVLEAIAAGRIDRAFRRWRRPTVRGGGRYSIIGRLRAVGGSAVVEARPQAEAFHHLVGDRPVQGVGAAEIALEHALQPGHVLDRQGLVEPELAVDPGDVLGRREGAQDGRRWIARDERDDQKDDHRDPEQHRDGERQPAQRVGEHGPNRSSVLFQFFATSFRIRR